MTTKQKVFLVLATHFYTEYLKKDKDKEVDELIKAVNRQSTRYVRDEKEVHQLIELMYKHLEDITEGKDIDTNGLGIFLNSIFILMELDTFKLSQKLTVKRLALGIYHKLWLHQGTEEGFRNANTIVSRLEERL